MDLGEIPVTESELEHFRSQWKRQLKETGAASKPASSSSSSENAEPGSVQSPKGKGKQDARATKSVPTKSPTQSPPPASSLGAARDTTGGSATGASEAKTPARKITQPGARAAEPKVVPAPVPAVPAAAPAPEAEPQLTSSQARAIEMYEEAMEFEQLGQLADALAQYRAAFRLDPDVDLRYTARVRRQMAAEAAAAAAAVAAAAPLRTHGSGSAVPGDGTGSTAAPLPPLADWVAQLREQHVPLLPARSEKPVLLALLHDDVLLRVLAHVFAADLHAFTAVSLVCKRLCVLAREPTVWRTLCRAHYPHRRAEIDAGAAALQAASAHDADGAAWMAFYRSEPRLRADGAYIAQCRYIRQGLRTGYENAATSAPILIVEYYRALRFFRDGTCVCLTTTDTPAKFVKHLGDPRSVHVHTGEGYQVGRYAMVGDTVHVELRERARPGIAFHMTLNVRGTKKRANRGWRLEWERYVLVKDDDPTAVDEIETGEDYKPFAFAKVKSYIK